MISSRPNPRPGGPGFSVCVFFPLVTGSGYLKVPNTHLFATATQLLAASNITQDCDNKVMWHMTSLAEPMLDGKAFPKFLKT